MLNELEYAIYDSLDNVLSNYEMGNNYLEITTNDKIFSTKKYIGSDYAALFERIIGDDEYLEQYSDRCHDLFCKYLEYDVFEKRGKKVDFL